MPGWLVGGLCEGELFHGLFSFAACPSTCTCSIQAGHLLTSPHKLMPHHHSLQATGGMHAFLQQFSGCLELLRRLPPRPQPPPSGDADMADAAGGAGEENAYRHSVEATVNTFLVLMTNMRCVLMTNMRCGDTVLVSLSCLNAAECAAGVPVRRRSTSTACVPHVLPSISTLPPCSLSRSHAPMVINSPNSANLIVAPVPGAGAVPLAGPLHA